MLALSLLCVVLPNKAYAVKGADVSTLIGQENFGVVYNECGVPKDMLTILTNHGITLARIRLFVNPNTSDNGTAMDLAYVTTLAARCKSAGMQVMLTLHYSDTWADPDTQTKPAAWSSLTQAQLVTQVYNYTYNVCSAIQPNYVQIGNEITCGMLWPNGEICSAGNWANLRAIITSGHNAVKAACSATTIVHVSETSAANLKWFFDNLTASSVSFDAIGISYYPEWHGSISNFTAINNQAKQYGRTVWVCEIGDYYTGSGYSETTQATFVTNVLAVNSNAIYWEPGWVWSSSVGNRALFKPINSNYLNVEMTAAMLSFGGSACGSNVAPTVSITSPANGATYTAPANITINATASDSDGTIASVKFYQASTLLNTDTSSPYSYTWSSVAAGTYSLTAVATDDDGATTTSSAVSVTVSSSGNIAPTVSITSPANGATYTAPATITINATASDSDGTISSVAFYQGSTLLGTDTTSPYSYTWSSVAAGTYSLTAAATDNGGATTTSSAVSVTVNASASAPTYQAVGSAVSGTGAISPAWPTHQSGDVALLIVETANQAVTLSTPAGFVAVTNSPQGTGTAAGTSATRLTVFWKRATSSAEATPTVADSGDHQIARIITFRGVTASGNPWDVTAGNVASSASRTVTIPGTTTTVANSLVVAIVARANDSSSSSASSWANSNLTSLTERIDGGTTSGNGGGFAVATGVKATAGATGNTTATLSSSSVQGRMCIALKP